MFFQVPSPFSILSIITPPQSCDKLVKEALSVGSDDNIAGFYSRGLRVRVSKTRIAVCGAFAGIFFLNHDGEALPLWVDIYNSITYHNLFR